MTNAPPESQSTTGDGRKYAKKEDTHLMPSIYDHCVNTYKAMLSEAKAVVTNEDGEAELGDIDTNEQSRTIIVYEGFLTALITQDLRLSVPYYSAIRKLLRDMGCIRQLKRGGGTSPSQWELIMEPTEELYWERAPKKEVQLTKAQALAKRVDTLQVNVGELQESVQSINEFLAAQFGAEEE